MQNCLHLAVNQNKKCYFCYMNDLTVSNIERQNVLNNNYALQTIQENLDVNVLRFHDQLLFTTKMVADFYGVDERTIKRYVQEHGVELRANGYFF